MRQGQEWSSYEIMNWLAWKHRSGARSRDDRRRGALEKYTEKIVQAHAHRELNPLTSNGLILLPIRLSAFGSAMVRTRDCTVTNNSLSDCKSCIPSKALRARIYVLWQALSVEIDDLLSWGRYIQQGVSAAFGLRDRLSSGNALSWCR